MVIYLMPLFHNIKVYFLYSHLIHIFVTKRFIMAGGQTGPKSVNIYPNYDRNNPKNESIARISIPVAKERFLELFMLTANITKTCQILGLAPRTVFRWKNDDAQFAEDFKMANEIALTVLEDEATRRAVYGVRKPVYQGGRLVGYQTEYSDTLLIVLLKGRAPEKYRENWKGELTGANGAALEGAKITVNHVYTNAPPLANNEEEILLREGKQLSMESRTQDINYELIPAEKKEEIIKDIEQQAAEENATDDYDLLGII